MKKGYRKILIFEILLIIIFLLNSFIESILDNYVLVGFLLGTILIFKMIFGVEKEKKRYLKDIVIEILIVYLIGFALFYLFGILTGFYKNNNYFTFTALKDVLLPLILFIVLKEYLRSMVLTKVEGNKFLNILSCIMFILLEMTAIFNLDMFVTKKATFDFIALYLMPSISSNIVANLIIKKSSYKINLLWIMILQLYAYVLPIIPNVGNYILSILRIIVPVFIYVRVKDFFVKESDEEIPREYNKRSFVSLVIVSLLSICIIYFTSGHFHYQAVAIASGSMEPLISRGDIVIIEKINKEYDKIHKGDIIAYYHKGNIIVHRLEKVLYHNGKHYFYTKGDANAEMDKYVIYEEEIIGKKIVFKLPYLGLPTIWLSEI